MFSSTATTVYLPSCLLLLVHLHLLEYPCSNRPEYDHNIFNPRTRGLRERARTMEEVTYYLVGKLEGKSIKNVSILHAGDGQVLRRRDRWLTLRNARPHE
ncbi:hypothetical protein BJ912DRAFT_686472 [Pholiota molesta]|nr:hypothetical protein BJ912DRAFT_686472 [Pholiota molesta]